MVWQAKVGVNFRESPRKREISLKKKKKQKNQIIQGVVIQYNEVHSFKGNLQSFHHHSQRSILAQDGSQHSYKFH